MDNTVTPHILKLRIRNNIIDYLGLASSPTEQRDYERRVPIAQVPNEIINQWEDSVDSTDFGWYSEPEYSLDEQTALKDFNRVWNLVADETPNPLPYSVDALIGTPIWQRLIDAAGDALRVFEKRGRIASESND